MCFYFLELQEIILIFFVTISPAAPPVTISPAAPLVLLCNIYFQKLELGALVGVVFLKRDLADSGGVSEQPPWQVTGLRLGAEIWS